MIGQYNGIIIVAIVIKARNDYSIEAIFNFVECRVHGTDIVICITFKLFA